MIFLFILLIKNYSILSSLPVPVCLRQHLLMNTHGFQQSTQETRTLIQERARQTLSGCGHILKERARLKAPSPSAPCSV